MNNIRTLCPCAPAWPDQSGLGYGPIMNLARCCCLPVVILCASLFDADTMSRLLASRNVGMLAAGRAFSVDLFGRFFLRAGLQGAMFFNLCGPVGRHFWLVSLTSLIGAFFVMPHSPRQSRIFLCREPLILTVLAGLFCWQSVQARRSSLLSGRIDRGYDRESRRVFRNLWLGHGVATESLPSPML